MMDVNGSKNQGWNNSFIALLGKLLDHTKEETVYFNSVTFLKIPQIPAPLHHQCHPVSKPVDINDATNTNVGNGAEAPSPRSVLSNSSSTTKMSQHEKAKRPTFTLLKEYLQNLQDLCK